MRMQNSIKPSGNPAIIPGIGIAKEFLNSYMIFNLQKQNLIWQANFRYSIRIWSYFVAMDIVLCCLTMVQSPYHFKNKYQILEGRSNIPIPILG
jgi:hypothetical protein